MDDIEIKTDDRVQFGEMLLIATRRADLTQPGGLEPVEQWGKRCMRITGIGLPLPWDLNTTTP